MDSHAAITAHYSIKLEDGNEVMKNCLISFRVLHGSHTGGHLAEKFLEVIDELGIADRVCNHFCFVF